MLTTALVPVRMSPVAKRRLGHVAGTAERGDLVRQLLEHVVAVLQDAGLSVIALAPHALERLDGTEVWQDRASGLNAAVDDAARRIGWPVLIVHADLPFLDASDVHALAASSADVVIGRARDGGTNALLLRQHIRPVFGPSSALAHARAARKAGLRAHVIDRPGLAVDVDDEAALSVWRAGASRQPRL